MPDEQLEDEIRRVGGLPEKVETSAPYGVQPGENGPQEPQNEPQSDEKPENDQTLEEDKKDAQEATEARKILGRWFGIGGSAK